MQPTAHAEELHAFLGDVPKQIRPAAQSLIDHFLADPRHLAMEPSFLRETVQTLLENGIHSDQFAQIADAVLAGQAKAAEQHPKFAKFTQATPRHVEKVHSIPWHKQISGEQKLFAGFSLLTAGLSAASAYGHAKQIRQTDAEGKTHTQWSQLGMALLSATFAAGLAYVGVQQARGRMGAF